MELASNLPARTTESFLVEDHAVRRAILRIIHERPGASFSEILSTLRAQPEFERMANGNLDHHLYRLVRAGRVSKARSGRRQCYFPKQGPWHADLPACALVRAPLRWRLAERLVAAPESSAQELREAAWDGTARTDAALRIHLGKMRKAGLVVTERRGRWSGYRATPRLFQVVAAIQRGRAASSPTNADRTSWDPWPGGLVPPGNAVAGTPARALV